MTRKGAKITDVEQDRWINGLPWMSKPVEEFPTLSIVDIRLDQRDSEEINKEKIAIRSFCNQKNAELDAQADKQINLRYRFLNYLINSNRFRFREVVRILALVCTFIKNISKKFLKVQNNIIFHHTCLICLMF